MKVLKFGGTSVGSVKSILSLKRIVENEAKKQSVVVVVSALGGITDKLLQTSQLALKGDEQWKVEFEAMVDRHHKMIDTIITDTTDRENLFKSVDALFEQLKSIYFGVYLIHDLSEKTQDAIVSYGERLSSKIVATLIRGAKWFDSRNFIKTERKNGKGKHVLDSELTNKLVKEAFAEIPRISLVPGFISRDKNTDRTTNLGRGGSDYTAAIIAAALDAEVLEIWTDVDGFMTADPRVIKSAYTINELSYVEAMELCNFGAKVIYPPTIYPVCVKNIPCTVIEVGPCVVTQVKTVEKDGYKAYQLGFEEAKEKRTSQPMMGIFKKAGTTPKKHLAEFKFDEEYNLGDTITVEIFNDCKFVDVIGTSKGKGFQGVVKRHGFGGVGQSTHGQDDRARKPGSIGACSYPAKVFKGMRMGGQMGGDRVTTQNLQVLKVIPEQNLLIVKGSFAGCKGSTVLIEK